MPKQPQPLFEVALRHTGEQGKIHYRAASLTGRPATWSLATAKRCTRCSRAPRGDRLHRPGVGRRSVRRAL